MLFAALIAFVVTGGDLARAAETRAPGAEPSVSNATGAKAGSPDRRPLGTLSLFNRPIVTFRATMLGIRSGADAQSAVVGEKRLRELLAIALASPEFQRR